MQAVANQNQNQIPLAGNSIGGPRKHFNNQNIRGSFGQPSNAYHHDRRHFDARRPAQPGSFGPAVQADGRRMEDANRLSRLKANKGITDRA